MGRITRLTLSYDKIPYQWLNELIDVVNEFDDEFQNKCNEAIRNLIDGAPENLDTLKELADAIQSNNTKLIDNIKYYDDITVEITDESKFEIDSNGVITKLSDDISDLDKIVIPFKIGDTIVTGLSDNLFKNNTTITSVILPDGITTIGDNCFDGCSSLNTIRLPKTINSIGDSAFSNCTSLGKIDYPDVALTNQFYNSNIESFNISDNTKEFNTSAFSNATIGYLNIPKNVQSLTGSFNNTSIKEMSITDSTTGIDENIFKSLNGNMTMYCPENSKADTVAKNYDNITVVYSMRDTDLNRYVLKEDGKGLSSNDYTDEDKDRLSKMPTEDELDECIENKTSVLVDELKEKSIPQLSKSEYPVILTDHLGDEKLISCKIYGSEDNVGELQPDNTYNIPLVIVGTNLININKCAIGSFDESGDFICEINKSYNIAGIKDNTQYSLSATIKNDENSDVFITFSYSDGSDGSNNSSECLINDSNEYKYVTAVSNKNKTVTGICVSFKTNGSKLYIKNGSIQCEYGNKPTIFTNYQDYELLINSEHLLGANDYIDLSTNKLYSGSDEYDIKLSGEFKTINGITNTIYCKTIKHPDKIDILFYQDINKILTNIIIDGGDLGK